jgi:hypothetical protein
MAHFPQFLEALARANGLGDNITWLFYPGMLLDSYDKWWDDFAKRPCAHEGIDICFFREGSGKISPLARNANIPAMDKGLILNRCKDFLGESLVIAHEGVLPLTPKVVFVYSHLEIEKKIVPGCRVEKNQIIGRTFDTSKKQSKLLSHLHFSCVELMDKIPLDVLDWDLFPDREKVNLINPVFI